MGGAQDGWLMIYDKITGFHVGGCQDPKKPSHAAPVGLKENARMIRIYSHFKTHYNDHALTRK